MAEPTSPTPSGQDDWGAGWESHRRRQLTFALAATPAERLRWLEEMIAIAHRSGALPRPRRDADSRACGAP
jgi:hypothetical protein